MLRLSGYWLIFTSILHFIINGFVFFPEQFAEIAQAGWWNAISPNPFNLNYEREAAFWCVMISPLLLIIGMLSCWLQEQKLIMPAFVGWILLATTIISGTMMPVSGVWLLLPPSAIILLVSVRNKDSNLSQSEE